jgi:hypothetical protein
VNVINTVPKQRYFIVNGVAYAVDASSKYVFQCKRGLWFTKNQHPEIVKHCGKPDWTAVKSPIQLKNTFGVLISAPTRDWETTIIRTTETIPSNFDVVDCVSNKY